MLKNIIEKEKNIQINPETGKRNRGRPRGSGKYQGKKIPVSSEGTSIMLPVIINNPRLENILDKVMMLRIEGNIVSFILKDGTVLLIK